MSDRGRFNLIQDLILLAAAVSAAPNVSAYYLVRYVLSRLETGEEKDQANRKSAAAAVLRRLDPRDQDDGTQDAKAKVRRPRKEDLVLNQYEQMIAMDVVAPEDIPVKFDGLRPSLDAS
ncbi:MAG: hypothetical protein Q9217_002372 [Psora testacea]